MRRLLETSDVSIEVVAQEAGFGSALSLRQHFRTALRIVRVPASPGGAAPISYRQLPQQLRAACPSCSCACP
jgi:AraC-like DNA-binding protein